VLKPRFDEGCINKVAVHDASNVRTSVVFVFCVGLSWIGDLSGASGNANIGMR
jgi:hypothetical protein